MYNVLCEILGYRDISSVHKLLREKNGIKSPGGDKLYVLRKHFGEDIFSDNVFDEKQELTLQEGNMITITELGKKGLIEMYQLTTRFFNSSIDCTEIDEHLLQLEEFRLAVPDVYYQEYVSYLSDMVYSLPEVETSDLLSEGNNLVDEYAAQKLIARHCKRTLEAKKAFEEFAQQNLAPLIHKN